MRKKVELFCDRKNLGSRVRTAICGRSMVAANIGILFDAVARTGFRGMCRPGISRDFPRNDTLCVKTIPTNDLGPGTLFMLDPLALTLIGTVALAGIMAWKFHQAEAHKAAELSEVRGRYNTLVDADTKLRERYGKLIDADVELAKLRSETERLQTQSVSEAIEQADLRAKLKENYDTARRKYSELQLEIALLEENLEDISFGVYKPHFSFQSSEQYKDAMVAARNASKDLVRSGRASSCPISWSVGESRKDGERMTKQYTKLQLRGFNGECEAALANVSWNNVSKMEERICKAFAMINELGGVMQISISREYLDAKVKELRLTYEYELKKYEEREEQRRIREAIREEEKAQQDFERARLEAEKEEERYAKAIEKARQEAANKTGEQLQKLTDQIASLESKVNEVRNRKERAIARAQLTKSGFVYVISNVGSFGHKVYKIGMTRRMEPMDRIVELSDASVPFAFDLHVMLYSDNAPELEGALHTLFHDRRLNKVNRRKEFYHDVELDDIEVFVKQRGLSAQFIKVAEAKEYRETMALIQVQKENQAAATVGQLSQRFPDDPFAGAR